MRLISRLLILTGTLVALVFAVGQPAVASQSDAGTMTVATVQAGAEAKSGVEARQACGFVGGEAYRHCSNNTWVLIDAQNIWGKTYRNICVGPGDTHLGYLDYWVISYAWYIGKTC